MHRRRHRLHCAIALAIAVPMGALRAEDGQAPAVSDEPMTQIETVTVLGSRRAPRASQTDTPVPVDVLPMSEAAERGGQFDLAQTLQYAMPSLNSTRQTGADGADLVDGAALRGLGSDQTLVLVNGKRRHTVSLVNIFGARDRGNTGTDLNAIPMLAIDRVEVLRDAAAAQYGSDAIAGVVNIALKRRPGCETVAGYGQYTRGDGENWLASGYCGLELANGGIVAVTAEYQDRGRSDRSVPRDNPRTIGDSEVTNRTVYLNGNTPLGERADFYFTAGMQSRDASSAAFARGGIGSDDIPSRNAEAMYPDGFVPFIEGDLEDRYAIGGVRGEAGQWTWNVSQTYGYNELRYTVSNTLNASIANRDRLDGGAGISPARFDAGGFSFEQKTTNLDVSRYLGEVLSGMNVAFGVERRGERYRIRAGEAGSYVDADGPGGGNAGSQGFPGFQPSDVTDRERESLAGYVDVETGFTDRLLGAVAVRYEDYDDFGSTLDGKIAASFRIDDAWLLRGSASTGFRAPSLQQKYFSSTITDFIAGEPVDVVIAPNDSELARAAGIPNLREETSVGGTLGVAWTPTRALSVTADAYRIDIDDRVVLSGEFDATDPNIGATLQARGVGLARFFVNAADTRTQGVDLTAAYRTNAWGGRLETFLGLNHSRTKVIRVNVPAALAGREAVVLGERERLFVENGAPRTKAVLGFDYTRGPWLADVKIIHFGEQTLGTFSGTAAGVPNQHYAAKTSADLALTYAFNGNARLTVGGTNVFDVFPTRQDPDETDNGHVHESVQFGLNGAAWFARLHYRF